MKRNICVSLLLLLLFNQTAGAQSKSFDTVLLRRMAETIQIQKCLDTIPDGIYSNLLWYQGKPVTVRIRHGYVQHLGFVLFSNEMRQLIANDAVCDFLERHSLQAQLPLERIKTVEKTNEEAGVVFLSGSMSAIPRCLGDSTLSFSVTNYDDKGYVATWDRAGESFCSLRFPADYYLLHGIDFPEAKEAIVRDLREWSDTSAVFLDHLDTLSLVKISDPNLFVSVGDSLFMSYLNANSYYSEVDSASYRLVDDATFPIETLANIAVKGSINNQIDIHLALPKSEYGFYTVDLRVNALFAYLREKGCVMYYGVIDHNPQTITVLIMAANKAEGYCHSIRLVCPKQVVVARRGQVSGKMTTFIPLSKIKTLFEDDNQ